MARLGRVVAGVVIGVAGTVTRRTRMCARSCPRRLGTSPTMCSPIARTRSRGRDASARDARRSCAIAKITAAVTIRTLGRRPDTDGGNGPKYPQRTYRTRSALKYPQRQPKDAERGIRLTEDHREEYAYLRLPPNEEMRSCVGLVLAGMVARAEVGVGGLEEAVEVLEEFHADDTLTNFVSPSPAGGAVPMSKNRSPVGGETALAGRVVLVRRDAPTEKGTKRARDAARPLTKKPRAKTPGRGSSRSTTPGESLPQVRGAREPLAISARSLPSDLSRL